MRTEKAFSPNSHTTQGPRPPPPSPAPEPVPRARAHGQHPFSQVPDRVGNGTPGLASGLSDAGGPGQLFDLSVLPGKMQITRPSSFPPRPLLLISGMLGGRDFPAFGLDFGGEVTKMATTKAEAGTPTQCSGRSTTKSVAMTQRHS